MHSIFIHELQKYTSQFRVTMVTLNFLWLKYTETNFFGLNFQERQRNTQKLTVLLSRMSSFWNVDFQLRTQRKKN